jgi:hypothetical protein
MKNLKNLIRDIFLQGILNNRLIELDNYLIEKSFEDRNDNNLYVTVEEKERVTNLLEQARLQRIENKKER